MDSSSQQQQPLGAATTSGGLNGLSCNGSANPTEQLALQLALLQGGLQPAQPPQTEWSLGDSSSGGNRGGLMEDLNRGHGGHNMFNGSGGGSTMAFRGSLEDLKMPPQRKSQNMTECVPVPTSEHVAEIVGRQGKNHCSLLNDAIHSSIHMRFKFYKKGRSFVRRKQFCASYPLQIVQNRGSQTLCKQHRFLNHREQKAYHYPAFFIHTCTHAAWVFSWSS